MTIINLSRIWKIKANKCQIGDILIRFHEPDGSPFMAKYVIYAGYNGLNDQNTTEERPVYRIILSSMRVTISDSWWWDRYDDKDQY